MPVFDWPGENVPPVAPKRFVVLWPLLVGLPKKPPLKPVVGLLLANDPLRMKEVGFGDPEKERKPVTPKPIADDIPLPRLRVLKVLSKKPPLKIGVDLPEPVGGEKKPLLPKKGLFPVEIELNPEKLKFEF